MISLGLLKVEINYVLECINTNTLNIMNCTCIFLKYFSNSNIYKAEIFQNIEGVWSQSSRGRQKIKKC